MDNTLFVCCFLLINQVHLNCIHFIIEYLALNEIEITTTTQQVTTNKESFVLELGFYSSSSSSRSSHHQQPNTKVFSLVSYNRRGNKQQPSEVKNEEIYLYIIVRELL